jgi:hypothetical protein
MAVRRTTSYKVRRIPLPTPGSLSQRARDTMKHLSEGWLPVHADLLTGIQANIHNGHYLENPTLLLEDIKKDPGLYFTAAKRLKKFSDINQSGFEPLELLQSLEQEQLKEVFQFEPGSYTIHRAEESSPSQELIHELSRLGGESAEEFADEVDQKPSTAHEGTLFRQLGLHLLAWNYPKLFAQTLSLHRTKGVDFDKELQNHFQVAPQQIGARFARDLEMSREIKQSLLSQPDRELRPELDMKQQLRLADICQLGELFARAQEPQFFPEAEDHWAAKESVLMPVLGKEVFRTVYQKAELIQEEEAQATDFGDLYEYIAKPEEPKTEGLLLPESNPHLASCSEEIQWAFVSVHRELERSKNALNAIRFLLEKGIPKTGAVRGCLYLQRKKDFQLQAALRFGDTPLPRYQRFLLDARMASLMRYTPARPLSMKGKE